MRTLNLDFLIDTSIENIIIDLNKNFVQLLGEIKSYLNLEYVYSDIVITTDQDNDTKTHPKEEFFNIGVKRIKKENSIEIIFYKSYKQFIRMILLREAYKCFVPKELQENAPINVFINQKVEIDLQNSDFILDWKELKRKKLINYEFLDAEFDRLEKFLKLEVHDTQVNPFQFFFIFIRKNAQLIGNVKDKFYDIIFEEYVKRHTEYDDDILETIRIITEIFYEVSSYRSLLDYQHHFKEFKENGKVHTKMSLRKFTENMKWIKNVSYLAPSYYVNWPALDIVNSICILKFHPLLEIGKIKKIISQLPFFLYPNYSRNNFSVEIIGFFLFPNVYKNDITNFLEKLELKGYVTEKKLYLINKVDYTTNLNYFRNLLENKNLLINTSKKDYKKEYQILFSFNYGHGRFKSALSPLDWLIIDRIRYYSITGFGFERRAESLKALKLDLLNEVLSQRNLIRNLEGSLKEAHTSPKLIKNLFKLIDNYKSNGFFYIKQFFYAFLSLFNLLNKRLLSHLEYNFFQIQEYIKKHGISNLIEENLILKNLEFRTFTEVISLFLKNKKLYFEKAKEYSSYYNLFKLFYDLKLFNLESIKSIIKDKSLIQKIYQTKEEKLKTSYENYKSYKITNQVIEQRIEEFLSNDPPIIHPSLLNTFAMGHFTKYNTILILKDTLKTRDTYKKLMWLFPRTVFIELQDIKSEEKYLYLNIQMVSLRSSEKRLLYSILFNCFRNSIICLKSYYQSGFHEAFSRKDFYDLEKEDFFYTKDLFDQFYLYLEATFDIKCKIVQEELGNHRDDLWLSQAQFPDLISNLEKRVLKEHVDLNRNDLDKLFIYNSALKENLMDIDKFMQTRKESFFKNYVKAIKIIPSFQAFGFGQYYLYFFPTELKKLDFRLLLHNSFQKINYPVNIDNSNSFLIKFLWPYRNPNSSFFNWLAKSKKVIREYCLFFIKKSFQIVQFNFNLDIDGWDLDPNRFRNHFQKILFDPDYRTQIPMAKEINVGELNTTNYLTPKSPEFKALIKLYNYIPIDLKSYLGTKKINIITQILELLQQNLIYPYLSLKNLSLNEKVSIILPNVKKEFNEVILKIFSFFNVGFIYEIEGEYFIYGFEEEVKFENGIMIKLKLPECQLDEFEKLFDLIFHYLDIKHYIILNDMVDGKQFLKMIFGNLDFLKTYNPLTNLIWNDKDKIWMNHKLFNEKFDKIYPPL